jgi:RNA polymerase sigma factor (sigma-70 family)
MPAIPLGEVLNLLHRAAGPQQAADPTDAALLDHYIARRDSVAFEALVRRHGPMVLGVCRRFLRCPQDAEDAFQTVFLVLIRKAACVKPRERLAGWLYGVARHAALKTREASFRRRAREKQMAHMPEPATAEESCCFDPDRLLDQELGRLPEKYRLPIILCHLEGRTRKEAARQLGWPEGTVAGRLARARSLLARRLTQGRQPLTGGALVAMLSHNSGAAPVPTPLFLSTVKAAAGAVPPEVAGLTQGVLKAMLLTKLKGVAAFLLAAALVGGGAVLFSGPSVFFDQPGRQKGNISGLATLAASTDPTPARDREKPKEAEEATPPAKAVRGLEGDWQAASFEQDHTKYSDRKYLTAAEKVKPITASFKGDHYQFTGVNVVGPRGAESGTVVVHPNTDPKSFELIPNSGVFKGEAFRGIFLRDGDVLTLCYSWPVKDRPTEFRSPPNSTVVLVVFKPE